jgi:hypothetical protein
MDGRERPTKGCTTAWTQDDSTDGGGREMSGTISEVERPKGLASRHSGDKVEAVENVGNTFSMNL